MLHERVSFKSRHLFLAGRVPRGLDLETLRQLARVTLRAQESSSENYTPHQRWSNKRGTASRAGCARANPIRRPRSSDLSAAYPRHVTRAAATSATERNRRSPTGLSQLTSRLSSSSRLAGPFPYRDSRLAHSLSSRR